MNTDRNRAAAQEDADPVLRFIVEGTAGETGDEFFAGLVKHVALALDVAGAWVTEYLSEPRRLRALSFWFAGSYIPDYEYEIRGTPCEPVIDKACLLHIPERVIELFPGDPDLKSYNAVSYMGVPLLDADGGILGHLAVLDTKPLTDLPRVEPLFRIFAARAAAELRRLRAESQVREREQKLSRLMDSALDAIIELDAGATVTHVNQSAAATFGCSPGDMTGRNFDEFLSRESARKLRRLAGELCAVQSGKQCLWVPGGFKAVRRDGTEFPAEASLARFEVRGKSFYTVILRNIHDQIESERKIASLTREAEYLQRELEEVHNFKEIISRSPVMAELFENIRSVAGTDATVLVSGETGAGKELVARALHAASARAAKPLIKVNCAAIPAALIESEFFGHEKGAFTGATQRREGRFALAHGGTIFLDEIGELPLELQPKLLRVLQEGEFDPVGGSQTRKVDVRVIAATNRDLAEAVRKGQFREDLYYRLNVFPIRVPPLRERREDIGPLACAFAEKYSRRIGRKILPLSSDCLRRLEAYDWPGNVRELQNVIERAVITSRDGRVNLDSALPAAKGTAPRSASAAPAPTQQILTEEEMRQMERDNLVRALEAANWRVSGADGAAALLGLAPSTFSSRMKALGIRRAH